MRLKPALIAIIFLLVLAVVPAAAQAAVPTNDSYLTPREANTPGTPFPDGASAQHTIPGGDPAGDIDEATTQTDRHGRYQRHERGCRM